MRALRAGAPEGRRDFALGFRARHADIGTEAIVALISAGVYLVSGGPLDRRSIGRPAQAS